MIDYDNARYPDVMLYCRTVVDTGDYVSTGVTTYAEGDLVEVELSEFERFSLKESVKVSVYSPVGLLVFRSTVIAVGDGSIVVLGSPQIASRFGEVRQYPRVPLAMPASLYPGADRTVISPLDITVENISLNGVGFKVFNYAEIPQICTLDLLLDENKLRLNSQIEIVRKEVKDTHMFYGARIVSLPGDVTQSLRAYILRRQVDLYYEHKRAEQRKNGQL